MAGKLFGTIIGLMFLLMGLYIMGETVVPTYNVWRAMQQWQPIKGNLMQVKHFDNDTQAIYSYKVNGQLFESQKVYVATFKDNIGSYHQNLYNKLVEQYRTSKPVTVWYNTQDPQQAVLDKNMRWGLFSLASGFCSIFVVIGAMIVYFSLVGKIQTAKARSLTQLRQDWQQNNSSAAVQENFMEYVIQHRHEKMSGQSQMSALRGDSPWRQNKKWLNNQIQSNAKSAFVGAWIIMLFWNGISSPILFKFAEEWHKQNYAIALALVFPLIGVYLIYYAVTTTLEWVRFGKLTFVMDPFPGAIGGNVGGHVDINHLKEMRTQYKVELECVYSYVSGSGKNKSRSELVKWAEAGTAKINATGQGVRLSFRFDIPSELPESSIKQTGDYYFWRLKLNADLPGVDLNRTYNIPVFSTGQHSQYVDYDISAQAQQVRAKAAQISQSSVQRGAFHETALKKSLRYTHDNGSDQFYYPMLRNKAFTMFAALFAGGFGFATYSIFTHFVSNSPMGLFMVIFAIPFALVALIASLVVIYLPLSNLTVMIRFGELFIKRRIFVFPIKRYHLRSDNIDRLSVKLSGSAGQGVKKLQYFKILAHTQDHRKITLAEGIEGEDLANQFKEFLADKLHCAAD